MSDDKNTVTKRHIVTSIAQKTGFTQNEVRIVVDSFLDEIKELFKKQKRIELRGFGVFYPFYYKGRSFKIPRTGEERDMESRLTLRFKTSKQLFLYKKGKKSG